MTRIVHTIGSLHPRDGGPTRTVTRLAECLAAEGRVSVSLLSQSLIGETIFPISEVKVNRHVAMSPSRRAIQSGLPLRKLVIDTVKTAPPQIIHDHGIWSPANYFVSAIARHNNIPLTIHPRGMLEPWALEYRAIKKKIAMFLYQKRILDAATLFIATAPQEVESLRRLGLKQPVAVIPNGVDIPNTGSGNLIKEVSSNSKHNALFLSRIHPKKGLLNLVEAWGRVRPDNWCLRIAGPDEGGHLTEVMSRVKALGLETSIEYAGEVEGDAKVALFDRANLFILPSFSENFGVVVAEALAHGVPVITTRGTPWEGLLDHGCGWWIDPTADALSEALKAATSMEVKSLRDMGDKGYIYVKEYNWNHIARQTADVYDWVLGQGSIPACVIHD